MSTRVIVMIYGFVLAVSLSACARARLSRAGSSVRVQTMGDFSSCRRVGRVSGTGGGSFGGGYIRDSDLRHYALNDVRNRAAKMGANYVRLREQTNKGTRQGSGPTVTDTIVLIGMAYRCDSPPGPEGSAGRASAGRERGPCRSDGTCDAGLTCASELCVRMPGQNAEAADQPEQAEQAEQATEPEAPQPLDVRFGDFAESTAAIEALKPHVGAELECELADGSRLAGTLSGVTDSAILVRLEDGSRKALDPYGSLKACTVQPPG